MPLRSLGFLKGMKSGGDALHHEDGQPKHVRMKRAKGKEYYYYDTGKKDADGKRVLTPLPHRYHHTFAAELKKAQRERFKHVTRKLPHIVQTFQRDIPFDPAMLDRGKDPNGDELYFIRAGDVVKIGHAKCSWRRMASMQADNHLELDCICLLAGRGHEERAWHAYFRSVRVRGEWFQWVPEIATAIALAKQDRRWWADTPLDGDHNDNAPTLDNGEVVVVLRRDEKAA